MSRGADLRVRDLSKAYRTPVLRGLDLDLPAGAYTCIMGPSGSGKTTLLRILAGLEPADLGTIHLAEQSLAGVPAERRPIHTVFQDLALFPHLSVRDNVSFSALLRGRRDREVSARVDELLGELGLDAAAVGSRAPDELSGGEQQRVAIARALFEPPRLLLLDEPLNALDRGRRAGLRRTLRALQRRLGSTFCHVTHDPEEALALADLLVVLDEGRVVAHGPPEELYRRPTDPITARLLGDVVELPDGRRLRPERVRIAAAGRGRLPARVVRKSFLGSAWEVELQLPSGEVLLARRPHGEEIGEGPCGVDFDDDDAWGARR